MWLLSVHEIMRFSTQPIQLIKRPFWVAQARTNLPHQGPIRLITLLFLVSGAFEHASRPHLHVVEIHTLRRGQHSQRIRDIIEDQRVRLRGLEQIALSAHLDFVVRCQRLRQRHHDLASQYLHRRLSLCPVRTRSRPFFRVFLKQRTARTREVPFCAQYLRALDVFATCLIPDHLLSRLRLRIRCLIHKTASPKQHTIASPCLL